MTGDLVIYNARLVDRDMDARGSLVVRDGRIASVHPGADGMPEGDGGRGCDGVPGGGQCIDARGAILMPAFIDLHAHFRDPGYTFKEDLETGSRAAAAGGYATVVCMANTDPVVSSPEAAAAIRERASRIGLVDIYQAVSLTRDFDGRDTSHLSSIDPTIVPLVSEDGREVASPSVMFEAMSACARTGAVVSCHCEDPSLTDGARALRSEALSSGAAGFAGDGTQGRPGPNARALECLVAAGEILARAEDSMTRRNLDLAREAGCRVHIAHVSTARSLSLVRQAKLASRDGGRAGFRVSCEVTPHHLALTDALPAIVNPPLRPRSDRAALIDGILDGTVDAIATDHAPHTLADKEGGAPGFSGIQTSFSVCNTALVRPALIDLSRLSALMSANPAAILSLPRGLLRAGLDADLVLVDPDGEFVVGTGPGDGWESRGINTPFAGERLFGVVLATFRHGSLVYRRSDSTAVNIE